jgi:hypothetical protein
MKAMFHRARRNDILESIPNIDAISKGKVIVDQEKYIFDSQQINKLLSGADIKMRVMIWLGLNCGFGCTDCGKLKWKNLYFKHSRVKLSRNKTGIRRNLPLTSVTAILYCCNRCGFVLYYNFGICIWAEVEE